ncbi:hypothetical protein BDN72DRAFT_320715 [Pluteus cervinus]|uniref:Uncharacterized protein n=1 Tax=Pluteus cervinus TaxID=181527 RepID=A0ACD3ACS4_9AGAR|nr:hypothetical protein BDN72DRAFT_320715 [Pluteus cervinus]
MYLRRLFPHVLVVFLPLVYSQQNITLDDNDPAIVYQPKDQWSQSAPSPLDAGGSHMLTSSPGATALLQFTGVAVYFMSPLWPYHVTTAVQLDDEDAQLLVLTDTSRNDTGGGPETVQSAIVWSKTGLNNTSHRLSVYVGAGEPFAIVDTIIYTTLNSTPSGESSSPSAVGGASGGNSSSPNTVAIVLGVIFAVLGLAIIIGLVWLCCWRKRRDDESEIRHYNARSSSAQGEPSMAAFSPPQSLITSLQNHPQDYSTQAGIVPSNPSWVSHPGSITSPGPMAGVGAGGPSTGYVPGGYSPPHGYSSLWTPPPGVPQSSADRGSNRYTTLSTITETSGPGSPHYKQHSPMSQHSELEYRPSFPVPVQGQGPPEYAKH